MSPEPPPDDLRALWRPLPAWVRRVLVALGVLALLPLVVLAAFAWNGIGAYLLVVPLVGVMVFTTWRRERREQRSADRAVTARPPH